MGRSPSIRTIFFTLLQEPAITAGAQSALTKMSSPYPQVAAAGQLCLQMNLSRFLKRKYTQRPKRARDPGDPLFPNVHSLFPVAALVLETRPGETGVGGLRPMDGNGLRIMMSLFFFFFPPENNSILSHHPLSLLYPATSPRNTDGFCWRSPLMRHQVFEACKIPLSKAYIFLIRLWFVSWHLSSPFFPMSLSARGKFFFYGSGCRGDLGEWWLIKSSAGPGGREDGWRLGASKRNETCQPRVFLFGGIWTQRPSDGQYQRDRETWRKDPVFVRSFRGSRLGPGGYNDD